jgi:hypothetical protein
MENKITPDQVRSLENFTNDFYAKLKIIFTISNLGH